MLKQVIDDNVELVPIHPEFADEIYALVDANRERLGRWFPWVDGMKTPDDTRAFIDDAVKRGDERGDIVNAICANGKIAGMIGLEEMNRDMKNAEIIYWLGEQFEGKGLIIKACRMLIDHAFGILGLQRVHIMIDPANVRSRAIPRKLGFHYEGTLRRYWRIGDNYYDLEVYSILRDEWVDYR